MSYWDVTDTAVEEIAARFQIESEMSRNLGYFLMSPTRKREANTDLISATALGIVHYLRKHHGIHTSINEAELLITLEAAMEKILDQFHIDIQKARRQ